VFYQFIVHYYYMHVEEELFLQGLACAIIIKDHMEMWQEVCHLSIVYDGYAAGMHKGVPRIDTDQNSSFEFWDGVVILQFLAEDEDRRPKCTKMLHFSWDILPGKHHMQ
jgi:hypothetical protein